jgi:drug/metabolite transporter (DMT)-like permease
MNTPPPAHRWRIPAAFAAVYLIWGSTYLGIRFAIETIPPFLMAGTRFLIAGAILYAAARLRGTRPTSGIQWRAALVVGGLMLLGGNGGVVWAEQVVPSGQASLMIATVPLWLVLLNWVRGDRVRPTPAVVLGLGLGLLGITLLAAPTISADSGSASSIGLLVLALGSLSWAIGSLYSRVAPMPQDGVLGTAMEMLAGGALLTLAGLAVGEAGQVHLEAISQRSIVAYLYLILFGSLVGFSAYVWLLKNTTPALVGTYAFVNPIVAVFLGWALAGEPLSWRMAAAAAAIVAGVALITLRRR